MEDEYSDSDSASAIDILSNLEYDISGCIIESGFATEEFILDLLDLPPMEKSLICSYGFDSLSKIKKYLKPLLVIHADRDHIIPLEQANLTFDSALSENKKIVVVEDNDMFALAVEQAFRESVFIKSEFYKSPDIFLKNIAELPDIYVLDYNLNHELNGRDLLIRIKEVNPKAVVIMLSAQKEVSVAIDLMKNGASYYLLKTRDNLRRLVKIIEGI